MTEFRETFAPDWGQWFTVDEVLFEKRTDLQDLIIFRNAVFGRVMALDGIIQTTEGDEFIYHEMLAHVPILAHGAVRRVLIIGGGDGGMLREVLRHRSVERAVLVEIDAEVLEICRRYLPNHAQGAFDDRRASVVIEDGAGFLRRSEEGFDLIICDSTDPVGPAEALYSREFYAACRAHLNPGGLFVAQNGEVFHQLEQILVTAERLGPLFADCTFYGAAVPTYLGGIMAFAWATDNRELRSVAEQELARRYAASGIITRYYTPAVHHGAFALPRFVQDAVEARRASAAASDIGAPGPA